MINLTDEQMEEARHLEDDPETILRLIDLIFLGAESCSLPPT